MPTTNPAIQVAVEGVRKRGCTRPNKRGRSPSRDIANQTRACPSWNTSNDEIMPIIAPNNTPRRTQCSVEDPVATVSAFRLFTTGAALSSSVCQGTSPVNTTATATYNSVQTTRVAIMPIGKSRCGLRASSAAGETESNPMYVKKMIDPPVRMPDQPIGAKGCQFPGFT